MKFGAIITKIPFTNAPNFDCIATHLIQYWQQQQSLIVHFMYYASLERIRTDINYANAMALANIVLVDGIGMQIYFKWALQKKMSNLNGTDLSPILMRYLFEQQIPVIFYGTTKEQITACANAIQTKYKHHSLCYYQDGYSDLDFSKVPDNAVVFVGMGTPKQELWVANNYHKIQEKKLFVITIGGYFDFLSGLYIRAPKWVRSMKLEWAWRTVLHPNRHYHKRLRDMTIVFRPFLDKILGNNAYFHVSDITCEQ